MSFQPEYETDLKQGPEIQILKNVVRRLLGLTDLQSEVTSPVDWQRLLWLGRRHGVLVFLADPANASLREGCPTEIIDQIGMLREVITLRSLARMREICRLRDAFALQEVAYVSADALAPNGPPAPHLLETTSAMHAVVYESMRERARDVIIAADHPISLQGLVTLGRSPVLINRGVASHNPNRVVEQSRRVPFGGRILNIPSQIHSLLACIWEMQVSKPVLLDCWQLVSATRSLGAIPWGEIFEEADALGLDVDVASAVKASHEMLGIPVPTLGVGRAKPSSASRSKHGEQETALDAPFLPTNGTIVTRMLEFAEVAQNDVVYDVGCGDGRIVIEAARRFGCRAVGIERNPTLIAEADRRAKEAGVSSLTTFICDDMFNCSIAEATVLCLYLLPSYVEKIREHLLQNARPGLKIVSHDYAYSNWAPWRTEIVRTGPLRVSQLYIWRLPGGHDQRAVAE